MEKNEIDDIYNKFSGKFLFLKDLGSVSALLMWDQDVVSPEDGVESRSRVQERIALLSHQKVNDRDLIEDVKILRANKGLLSDVQSRCVDRFYEMFARTWKISPDIASNLAKTSSLAKDNWAKARKHKSFKELEPSLEKIFYLKQREAEQIGFENHPYDALLDEFEPGMNCKMLDSIFENLIPIVKQYRAYFAKKISNNAVRYEEIDPDKQFIIVKELMKNLGFDFKRGRIDIGPQPATFSINEGDVRIIARMDKKSINTSVFLTLHEFGHALYYQNIDLKYSNTPLFESSTGMHEAQAKIWENFIGKSVPFWQGNSRYMNRIVKPKTNDLSAIDFMYDINKISDSPIRFDADELSFIIHIYIRYLIEKKLIEGSIYVRDIPEVWNNMMKDYLNINISNDLVGCLQDIHWANGSVGYFPTYVIGNIYAAQIYHVMRKEICNFEDLLRQSDYSPIINWLNANVYSFGAYYSALDIIKRISGERDLKAIYFIDYIKSKYTELYV